MYSARLHGTENPEEVCETVISDLGLTSCKDTKVGSVFIKGLSGGQKRRLSLACELVNQTASFFFLDEPTSGLDAAAASETMKLITRVSKERNVVFVASIHQPSSHIFYSFDQLMVLSKGRLAYYGSSKNALGYFEAKGHKMQVAMNPADYLLEIVNADFTDSASVDKLLDEWQQAPASKVISETNHASIPSRPPSGCSGFAARFWTLCGRAVLCFARDPAVYLYRMFLYAFMSIFLGLTYEDVTRDQKDVSNMLFSILWCMAFFSFMAMLALPAFALEKNIVIKEITNGYYGLGEYVISSALVQIPVLLLAGFISSIGPYWFVNNFGGINPDFWRYLQYGLMLSLHLYIVESFAILIAVLVPNFVIGIIMYSSAISQTFVYNGFFINESNMPRYFVWIYYTSWFTYSTQGLFKIVFEGLEMEGLDQCQLLDEYPCYGATGEDVLVAISSGDQIGYNEVKLWVVSLVLCGFAILFRFNLWFLLRKEVY